MWARHRAICTLVALAFWVAGAKAESPTTAPATQPLTPDAAKAKYDTAMARARQEYVSDLRGALRGAMRSEDLSEANRIQAIIDGISTGKKAVGNRANAGDSTGERPPRLLAECDVQANRDDWEAARVKVHKGDRLLVRAEGVWCVNVNVRDAATYGPDGLHRDGSPGHETLWACLVARIGPRFYMVGHESEIVAERDGDLEFRSNDSVLGDNDGSLHVKIFALLPRQQKD